MPRIAKAPGQVHLVFTGKPGMILPERQIH